MQLLFIKELFGTQLMQAICWSLVHSLWQGLLVAIIAGIIILVTKRSGPVLRYNLLASLLLLFLLMISATFIREWNLNHPGGSIAGIQTPASTEIIQPEAATVPTETITDASAPSFTSRMVAYCNEHAALIVAIWFIIFSARVVKLLAELGTIQRLKHYKTYTPAAAWSQKLKTLAVQLKVRRPVQLLESGIVKVPVVIGFLKPVILMPLGLLANIPPHQVEAILLHELAHIKRRDYLVNLLQHFAESIFFFNPAVLWISSLIREEREHCCDDMAIAITQNKKQFVHALVAFQQYNLSASGYAMAFPGKKDHLLNRVKRLVNNNNKTLNAMEKSLLMACLLITGMLTFVYAQRPDTQPKPPGIASTVEKDALAYSHERDDDDQSGPAFAKATAGETGQMPRDTAPAFRNRYYQPQEVKEGTRFTFTETLNGRPYTGYLAKKEGTLYQFGKQNNKIIFLRIDGKDINTEDIASHDAVLQELLPSFQAAVEPVKPVEAEKVPAVKAMEEKVAPVKPVPPEANITAFGNLSVTGNNVRMNKGIITDKNSTRYFGNGYEVEEKNGKVVKVRFDNKELTPEEITMQQSEIQSVIQEAKLEVERGRLESIKKAQQDAYDKSQREVDKREKAVKDVQLQQEAIQRKIEDRRIRQDSIHQRNMERKIETQQRVNLRQTNALKLADKNRLVTLQKIEHLNKELRVEKVKLEQLDTRNEIQLQTPTYHSTPPVYQPRREEYKPARSSAFEGIRNELVKEGIIEKDATMVAITLNDTQLIVNGVEQSPALHKRLKEKYSPKGTFNYTTLTENTNNSNNNNDNRKK